MATTPESTTSFYDSTHHANDAVEELTQGLLADHAWISPKYFYDDIGSILFEAICELPEYYPTRVEASIFHHHQSSIAQTIPAGSTLIDLGAGNCAKAARLFSLIHPDQYVPVDISVHLLTDAVHRLKQQFPHIEMTALGRDFSTTLDLPNEIRHDQRLFFYPGSSIGNFHPETALSFLKQLRMSCNDDGGLLIGIDLIKDHATLNAAYNDALGITAAFNLNSLRHVNQLIGTDFDVNQWQHQAFFNPQHARMEIYVEARTDLVVTWHNHQRRFIRGERIHTEYSHKYSIPSFLQLLESAGFGRAHYWTDEKNWFAVIYAQALEIGSE